MDCPTEKFGSKLKAGISLSIKIDTHSQRQCKSVTSKQLCTISDVSTRSVETTESNKVDGLCVYFHDGRDFLQPSHLEKATEADTGECDTDKVVVLLRLVTV